MTMSQGATVPSFYKYSVSERLRVLYERKLLSEEDYHALMDDKFVIGPQQADRLIENVVGVFGLPLGLGLNMLVNGKDYLVPMAVEEPSIVAAVSAAAKVIRCGGGFQTECPESFLIGQIQIVEVAHASRARKAILDNKREILDLANSLHPNMVARGGGAQDVEVHLHPLPSRVKDMMVVHLVVDTRDAMGANLVNTMCEGVAPLVEKMTGGKVFLRILSNLTDRSMVKATCTIPLNALEGKGFRGEEVRDGIILATEFAAIDPYRATTHNKGVMNGIDPVAIATGNDWRAIEAAAHAYAGRGGSYTSLTKWLCAEDGSLFGQIELPLKVGIVGGQVSSNPAVGLAHRLMGFSSAQELAQVMAAVGLAQNFAALRALSTEGIQRGHMTLHARSCAVAAGAAPEVFETVVERLVDGGEIKVWRAKEIIAELESGDEGEKGDDGEYTVNESYAAGHGKIILLGEHAVVYGAHALAAPVPLAIQAKVESSSMKECRLLVPRWGIEETLHPDEKNEDAAQRALRIILNRLGISGDGLTIEVFPHVPRAMGLGGSAAMAVAIIRALIRHADIAVSDEVVNDIAFECEKVAHGTPSGIDNTLATYGQFILFQKGEPATMREIKVPKPIPIVIGLTATAGLTASTVAKVAKSKLRNPKLYEGIFAEMDKLTIQGAEAVERYDLEALGEYMNIAQGYLNALQVSCWELEELIELARASGALGAKLTGGGGGGSMIALCPDDGGIAANKIAAAMRKAGYRAIVTEVG